MDRNVFDLLRLQYGDHAWLPEGASLGLAQYGADTALPDLAMPTAAVPMPVLPHGGTVRTAWAAATPGATGQCARVRYRCAGQYMFGALTLQESDFVSQGNASAMQQASLAAYTDIFATLQREGYPYLARCWNYLPAINRDGGGLERYRQFNIGRQDAFIAARRAYETGSPAACALGTAAGPLVFYFLASRSAPLAIENPRQLSAYHYPSQYGPRSPTFSRASLLSLPEGEVLFISGTASIVGHESLHLGDVIAQTEETLRNIDAVVAAANAKSALVAQGQGGFSTPALHLKAFIRHEADYGKVARVIQDRLGDAVQVVYLQADICRAELLVEIEAVGFCQGIQN